MNLTQVHSRSLNFYPEVKRGCRELVIGNGLDSLVLTAYHTTEFAFADSTQDEPLIKMHGGIFWLLPLASAQKTLKSLNDGSTHRVAPSSSTDRTRACGARNPGFKSRRGRHIPHFKFRYPFSSAVCRVIILKRSCLSPSY